MRRNFLRALVLTWALMHLSPAQAAPTILSTVPANGTSGVSTTTTIVFTFSEEMDTNATSAIFYDPSPNFYTTTDSWNPGHTVLTCTPDFAFPLNTTISWVASGQNTNGDALGGLPFGTFTTGTGGGGGSGTNAITTFSVGKVHHYNQTSAGSPTLDPTTPYDFSGVTSLSSNRTATNIVLTLPTAAVSNLTQLPPPQAEIYILYGFDTSLSNYDATYPAGDYSFLVKSVSSNQTVVVTLPTTNIMAQPGAPHLTNYPAAQVIDPGQTFVLGWDAFPGGTSADYIDVDIGSAYGSPNPGLPGALSGTARTFTIPAGTLQPNSTYFSRVGFFRHAGATNADHATAAFRATYTEFSLITLGGGQLALINPRWTPSAFNFDVLCTNGQTVTVEYTNVLTAVNWTKLLTTNSPGPQFHVVSTQAVSYPFLFYRARNGP